MGWSSSAKKRTARPRCTSVSVAQVSGQSCGHAPRTSFVSLMAILQSPYGITAHLFKLTQAQPLNDRILKAKISRHAAVAGSMRRKPGAALVFFVASMPLHPEERHL